MFPSSACLIAFVTNSASAIIRSCAFRLRTQAPGSRRFEPVHPLIRSRAVRLDFAPELNDVGPIACVPPRYTGPVWRESRRASLGYPENGRAVVARVRFARYRFNRPGWMSSSERRSSMPRSSTSGWLSNASTRSKARNGLVVGVPRGEHAGESGLLEQHPCRKPRGRYFVLHSLLLCGAPRMLQGPIGKVRGFDHLLEYLGRKATRGEPCFNCTGPFAQSPVSLRESGEQHRFVLVARRGKDRSLHALPVEPLSVRPGTHGVRDCRGQTGPG